MADFDEGFGADVPVNNNVDDVDDGFGFSSAAQEQEGVAGADVFGFGDDNNAAAGPGDMDAAFGFGEEPSAGAAAGGEDVFGLGGSSGGDAAPTQAAPEVSDAYTAWEAEHAKALLAKAEKARADKAAELAAAKAELDAFYAKRDAAIKKNKAANKSDEKQWRADLDATNANGTQWEKVGKYCDLKARAEGKGGLPAKNERMRKVLLSLKNEKA